MRTLIVCVAIFLCFETHAQVKHQSSVEAGLVNGNWETNAYLQTTHGVSYKSWQIGLGAGLDYYRCRSAPVFVELQKSFGKKAVRPFVVAAAGVNVIWPTEKQRTETMDWWQSSSEYKNGFYSKLGVGVLLNSASKIRFSVRAAYNYKTFSRTYTEWTGGIWPPPSSSIEKTMEYRLNRLSVGFGVNF